MEDKISESALMYNNNASDLSFHIHKIRPDECQVPLSAPLQ